MKRGDLQSLLANRSAIHEIGIMCENLNVVDSKVDALNKRCKRIDFNYHTYKRHRGNKTHSKEYLSWEKNLLKRLDEQEIEIFKKL